MYPGTKLFFMLRQILSGVNLRVLRGAVLVLEIFGYQMVRI
jgi:hypothetical protein